MDFLRTKHGVQAEAGPLPGRVVASSGGRSAVVRLVGRRWYHETATASGGADLAPIHPAGMEWSVARVLAEALERDAL